MCSMPSKCPKCGSDSIDKELYCGAKTGDWICGECGATGWIGGNHVASNKMVSVQLFKGSVEAGVVNALVAINPDASGVYGYLTKTNLGQFESAKPVPIEFKEGRYVAVIL